MSQILAPRFFEYVAIVEAGSISKAARQIDIPRATLSRHLADLEEVLGVTLIHRETRSLTLTDAGEAFYQRARVVVETVRDTEQAVRHLDGVARGLLRASFPPGAGAGVAELVARYLAVNPEVDVEIEASNRHVDLVEEGFDVALRAGIVRDPNLMARRLATTRMVAVASPELLAEVGPIATIADLERLPCITGFGGKGRAQTEWPLLDGGQVEVSGRASISDLAMRRDLAVRGEGATLAPRHFVTRELESGELQLVLEDVVGAQGSLSIVWPEMNYMPPKVRAFIDVAVDFFEALDFTD